MLIASMPPPTFRSRCIYMLMRSAFKTLMTSDGCVCVLHSRAGLKQADWAQAEKLRFAGMG